MADRHLYQGRNAAPSRTSGESFPGARNSASSSTSANLRRNLFQNHLTRRPTPGASGMLPGAMGSSSMGRSNANADMGAGSALKLSESTGASVEIISRDIHGEIQMVDPPSPTPDELKDVALDERQESERERQRLADTIKYHQQRSSMPGQPEELLEAIRASLRAKVSALADDNWMYEAEDVPRLE